MWARAAWGRLIGFWDKTARLCLAYLAADCFFAVSAISASYSARSALHSSVCAIPMIAKIVGGNVFPFSVIWEDSEGVIISVETAVKYCQELSTAR